MVKYVKDRGGAIEGVCYRANEVLPEAVGRENPDFWPPNAANRQRTAFLKNQSRRTSVCIVNCLLKRPVPALKFASAPAHLVPAFEQTHIFIFFAFCLEDFCDLTA